MEVERDVPLHVQVPSVKSTARKRRMATGETKTVTKLELLGPTLYYEVSSTKAIDSGHDLTSSSALCAATGEQVCYDHLEPAPLRLVLCGVLVVKYLRFPELPYSSILLSICICCCLYLWVWQCCWL